MLNRVDACAPERIILRPVTRTPARRFKTGDRIELNGDGVVDVCPLLTRGVRLACFGLIDRSCSG